MIITRYKKHIVILCCFFISLSFFTYLLVKHNLEQPSNIRQLHSLLTRNGDTIEKRIEPVGRSYMLNNESVKLDDTAPVVAINGLNIYTNNCMMCHDAGLGGSPVLGDKNQWASRTTKGIDILYMNAINGLQGTTGIMPAKGGNLSLSDLEVKASVDFMLHKLK
ncbi:MAG: cytochrome c5 [Francisellaceae bacterium]|jgi:cytochrome c5